MNPVDRLSVWIGRTFSYVFLIAVALTCLEILLDYLFRAPTIWVHDTTIMLSAIGFLFGGAYALQLRAHIRITSVYDRFPPGVRHWCDAIAIVVALAYLLVLASETGQQAYESISIMERSGRAWNVPMPVVIRSALFLGTVLLIAQALSNLWVLFAYERRGLPAPIHDETDERHEDHL